MIFGESLHTRTFSFEGVRFLFTFNSLKFGELFIHPWYNGNIITHFVSYLLLKYSYAQYHVECYVQCHAQCYAECHAQYYVI